MAAHPRLRSLVISAAAAALVAPLAIVAALANPASAAVGPRPHEVYMYKVEKHVDLSGEYPDNYAHEHLSCNAGDYALDGMWRVDHVDQANPQLDVYGDERDVVFYASYSDGVDAAKWHYRFENFADGNAQVKLFLTCIRGKTEANAGHKHNVVVSAPHVITSHHALPVGTYDWLETGCNPGEYAIAPGFNFVNDEKSRIAGSWPTSDYKGWRWRFLVQSPNTDVDVAFRCLSSKVSPFGAPPHTHQIPMGWRPNGYAGWADHLVDLGIQEKQLSCDDGANGSFFQDYKAAVGAFWIDNYHHIWFLGMDPRPKTRAYTFWFDGSGADDVYLNTLCIKSRTGKQIKP